MQPNHPLNHLPPAVAQTVLRKVAPHVLPVFKGNARVRKVPRQTSWVTELSGMVTARTMQELLRIVTNKRYKNAEVFFRNPDCLKVNQIDQMLVDNKSTCVVYVLG